MLHKEQEIIDWAKQVGIIEKGDRLTQGLKTVEEIAELISHCLKDQYIHDDIGDIYVTLVVQAHMNNIDMSKCIVDNEPGFFARSLKERLADMVLDASLLLDSIQSPINDPLNTCGYYISSIWYLLESIVASENLDMDECIDIAYNEIVNRRGNMINGAFVKYND